MKNLRASGYRLISGLVISLFCAGGLLAQDNQPSVFKPAKEEKCFIDGLDERLNCYTFALPLNYDDEEGASVEVFAAVLKARSGQGTLDPIVILAGGPGQAASEVVSIVSANFGRLRNARDILVIDQRGTGRSHPIQCEFPEELPSLEDYTQGIAACRAAQTLDVREFHFENVIRDLEEVRRALGYETLNLFGVSWGTRTAAQYLRRYPQYVRSITIDGVLPPQVKLQTTVAGSIERAKTKLFDACAAQPSCAERFPSLDAQLAEIMAKAKAGELRYEGIDPLTGEQTSYDMPFVAVVNSLHSMFYSADATPLIPFMIDAAAKGNWRPWLTSNYNASAIGNSIYMGSFLSIICGEEVSRVTASEVARASRDSFAEDAHYKLWKAGCDGWQFAPAASDSHDPIESDVPTLVLSGDLDPITPPSMGEEWVKTFSNSRHIVVEGTGHNTSFIGCMPRLISDFIINLDVSALDTSCLDGQRRLPIVTGLNGTVQ